MPSAVVTSTKTRQLDARSVPPEQVTEEQVGSTKRLAELLGRLLVAVTELRRAWAPQRLDFEDLAVTTTAFSLEHRFGGRVRWWVVDWQPTTPGSAATFERHSSTTSDALWLTPANAGTVTIRVEESG